MFVQYVLFNCTGVGDFWFSSISKEINANLFSNRNYNIHLLKKYLVSKISINVYIYNMHKDINKCWN